MEPTSASFDVAAVAKKLAERVEYTDVKFRPGLFEALYFQELSHCHATTKLLAACSRWREKRGLRISRSRNPLRERDIRFQQLDERD
jgi:hypothetical protein